MKSIGKNRKSGLVSVFLIVVGLLYFQQMSTILMDNLAMTLANQALVGGQDGSDINDALLTFITETFDTGKTSDSRTYLHKVVLGNLYWKTERRELAKDYWDKADIGPEFFVRKIEAIEQPSGLDYINRAIFLSPTRSELLYYKGLYFEKNGDFTTAKQWYDMAEENNKWINPVLTFDVLYERGQLLYQNKQYREAENVFNAAVKFSEETAIDNRKIAALYRLLGVISQQNGQISLAKTYFLQAIKLNPEDFWNYLSLGLIADAEKESEETVFGYFDRARIIAPQNLLAYTYPASYYLGQNQFDKWRYFCQQTPQHFKQKQQWLDVCQTSD